MKVINPVVSSGYAPYTRAGTAYYVNEAGAMTAAAPDVVRFDWTNGTFNGALVEPTRTNLLLNSVTYHSGPTPTELTYLVESGQYYTLSFFGSGYAQLKDASILLVLGTSGGIGIGNRTSVTFRATSNNLGIVATGTLIYAQLEKGSSATSYILTTVAEAIRPACVVTGYGLIASSFTDATALYNPATTYALNAVVRVAPRLYASLQAGNTGHAPATSPTWWLDTGPDNPYAMLDQQVSTPSIGASGTEQFALRLPSNVDAVAVLDTVSTSVRAAISTGYSGFSSQTRTGASEEAIFSGFTAGNTVSVQLNNSGLLANAGEVIVGTSSSVGDTHYGVGVSMLDYSKKTTDEFGTTTFVPRGFSKRVSATVEVDKADFNTTLALLISLRATPAVWLLSDDTEWGGANVYGFLRDLKSVIEYPKKSLYRIEIEGLL
jgi:hypothetical protein